MWGMDTEGKQRALAIIDSLPDDVSLQELIYQLAFRAHVEEGLRDSAEGRTFSHEEVKLEVAECRQTAGLKGPDLT
jgi:predicted transcriptional regulator